MTMMIDHLLTQDRLIMTEKETLHAKIFGTAIQISVSVLIVLACVGGIIGLVKWIWQQLK